MAHDDARPTGRAGVEPDTPEETRPVQIAAGGPGEPAGVTEQAAASEEVAAGAAGGPMAPQLPPPPACPNGFIYTVQPGDTLFFIAQRFGVTLQALIAANPQIPDPSLIFPGQQICVPTGVFPPPPPCPNGFIYTVQPGDTLFLIAQRFGVSLQALIAANPQITNPNLIFPGQQICVPVGGPPQVPTVECCMLLFRTANVPRGPEAGGVARIFQSAAAGANVLIGTIDLPAPTTFGGNTFVAWLRGVAPNGRTVKVPLVRTNPLLTPRVWAGSLAVPPGQQLAPFNDLIVTAELSADVMQPSLNRIVLIGLFAQCQPQLLLGGNSGPAAGGGGGQGGSGGSGCCG
ncbi:SafA/ExsA family spore coat assembly protein [Thermaerobacter sp. PB12/4term]|uniref:LysM peptidoglycan-binding domain-containing protein n=1 Tax=Thermaerobacter sp. PB12/4term TaxID=2293838 RepID=UPI000E32C46F|nr:SafA/ExsA family spore coat assembly protein [Thermaerobacter sp. PB12/4term]